MRKQNNKGSVLVLILLVGSVIFSIGFGLLSTSEKNFKMKIVNSRVKRTFYTAEGALEEAYLLAFDFIDAAVDYAEARGCSRAAYIDYLFGRCDDLTSHKSLVNTLKDKANYIIYKGADTAINAIITGKMNYYQLQIISTGSDGKIQKKVDLFCNILIPDDAFMPGSMDADNLISIHKWVRER